MKSKKNKITMKNQNNQTQEQHGFEDDDARVEPNFAITQADLGGMRMYEVEYYPEDIEKMKKMNSDELREYKKKLLKEDRYKLEDQ